MDSLAHHLSLLSTPSVERALKKQLRQDRITHLRSINLDSRFVLALHRACGSPPLFANLRCGVWYVPPSIRTGTCYFKSTDGHAGRWDFSLSRINLQTALAAARDHSVMIVDSTRSGKRFPDALTKTVAIWCCVINCSVHGAGGDGNTLWLPDWISASEASQIERLVDRWVAALLRPALAPVLTKLRSHLKKPLRPFWCCPELDTYEGGADWHHGRATGEQGHAEGADYGIAAEASTRTRVGMPPASDSEGNVNYYPVYCVCASAVRSAATSREHHSWTYVQGALRWTSRDARIGLGDH